MLLNETKSLITSLEGANKTYMEETSEPSKVILDLIQDTKKVEAKLLQISEECPFVL